MTGTSSERLNVTPAPGGLRLVQELVNTATTHPASAYEDLLASLEPAQAWLDQAVAQWAEAMDADVPDIALAVKDLARLRRLRERVRGTLLPLRDLSGPDETATVSLSWRADGLVQHRPNGSGARTVTSLVLAEIFVAQHDGSWRRFKACASDVCAVAFYDQSPNGTRTWHDTSTCGNRHNLRTSRARRAGSAEPPR